MAREGERLFVQYHCAGCHGASQKVQAPRLEGVYGKPVPIRRAENQVHFVPADDRYIRDSILLPKSQVVAGYEPIMPSFKGHQRGRPAQDHRLHQVDRGVGRGDRIRGDDGGPCPRHGRAVAAVRGAAAMSVHGNGNVQSRGATDPPARPANYFDAGYTSSRGC